MAVTASRQMDRVEPIQSAWPRRKIARSSAAPLNRVPPCLDPADKSSGSKGVIFSCRVAHQPEHVLLQPLDDLSRIVLDRRVCGKPSADSLKAGCRPFETLAGATRRGAPPGRRSWPELGFPSRRSRTSLNPHRDERPSFDALFLYSKAVFQPPPPCRTTSETAQSKVLWVLSL